MVHRACLCLNVCVCVWPAMHFQTPEVKNFLKPNQTLPVFQQMFTLFSIIDSTLVQKGWTNFQTVEVLHLLTIYRSRFDSIRLWIMSAVDWLKPHFRKLKQCSTRHIEFEKWELMIRSALYTFRKESMWKRFRSSWIGQYHWMRSMPRQFDCHALQRSTIFDVRCLNTQ